MSKLLENLVNLTPKEVANILLTTRFADSIDIINNLDFEVALQVIEELPIDYSIELFDRPELHNPEELLESLPTDKAIKILDQMSADQVADVFQDMSINTRNKLIPFLQPETRQNLHKLINYPEESAGSLMTTEYISVPGHWQVERVLQYIKEVERTRETVYAIYIVDIANNNKLLRAVSLRQLITVNPSEKIIDITTPQDPIVIHPLTKREELATLFRRYDLLAVPVVDNKKHLLGIVTVDDVLDSMTADMTKESQQFGGSGALEKPYMSMGFWELFQKRYIWLAILFLGELLTTSAMQHYELELERAVILSLFIPLIMSSGGNSGSQATSLIIRSLALQEISLKDWWKIAMRELPMGLSLGIILGIIGFVRIAIWQELGFYDYGEHWQLIGWTIAVTLVGIVTWGCLIGSMFPFLMKLCRLDPAVASAPFIATLVDVTGIVIYFSVATIILKGTFL
ncbi:magnesium transporter [Bartonella sp. DGB1]|uniref:magnesium transporter n=1 Tax=Bartonella sp. DGB1 TaxID=3239807 RepID=UPI0035235431